MRPELKAVGPWNKKSADDDLNREYFAEFVEVVLKALTNETFSPQRQVLDISPRGFVNPHEHPVYARFGQGVDANMGIHEVGIAPRPRAGRHPPVRRLLSASLRHRQVLARHKGRPIVLSGNTEFLRMLWREWREEALGHGHEVNPGDEACWGGIMVCAENRRQGASPVPRHGVVLELLGRPLRPAHAGTAGRLPEHPKPTHRAHHQGRAR